MRYPQMKKLDTADALAARLAELGAEIPLDAQVEADGILSTPADIRDRCSLLKLFLHSVESGDP